MGIIPSVETTQDLHVHSSDFDSFALLSEKENENKNMSSSAIFLPGSVCCCLNAGIRFRGLFHPHAMQSQFPTI